jgi:hypothetical protein
MSVKLSDMLKKVFGVLAPELQKAMKEELDNKVTDYAKINMLLAEMTIASGGEKDEMLLMVADGQIKHNYEIATSKSGIDKIEKFKDNQTFELASTATRYNRSIKEREQKEHDKAEGTTIETVNASKRDVCVAFAKRCNRLKNCSVKERENVLGSSSGASLATLYGNDGMIFGAGEKDGKYLDKKEVDEMYRNIMKMAEENFKKYNTAMQTKDAKQTKSLG